MKIAREGQKLIKAQRQLESIRLLDELFDRIKIKVENNEINIDEVTNIDAKKEEKKNNKVDGTIEILSSFSLLISVLEGDRMVFPLNRFHFFFKVCDNTNYHASTLSLLFTIE